MDEISWHRRETRRKTEKTNLVLELGSPPPTRHEYVRDDNKAYRSPSVISNVLVRDLVYANTGVAPAQRILMEDRGNEGEKPVKTLTDWHCPHDSRGDESKKPFGFTAQDSGSYTIEFFSAPLFRVPLCVFVDKSVFFERM